MGLYVVALFGISHPSRWTLLGIALIGLWGSAFVNLAGIRQMAWFQNVTVVLKFLPLLFVGTVGRFFVSSGNFGAFNASRGSLYSAIGLAAGIALFSFIGVETAAITARRVRDPGRNVGRASVIGTVASALLVVGHLRIRLPGRLPGHDPGAHRPDGLPLPQGPPRTARRSRRATRPARRGRAAALPQPGTLLSSGSGKPPATGAASGLAGPTTGHH